MTSARRVAGLERERVLLVHDEGGPDAGHPPGPWAHDVHVAQRGQHGRGTLAAEVPDEPGQAGEDASGPEVDDADVAGDLRKVVALGLAQHQVHVVPAPGHPPASFAIARSAPPPSMLAVKIATRSEPVGATLT